MKIQGGLKSVTQQPAALARWFLIAPELSRLAAEAETLVGIQTHSSTHHHDLSTAVISRFDENVKKLKEEFKANNPFAGEDSELVNIITKAVMLDQVKDAVLTRYKAGQELFSKFGKERIVERELSVWSPMKKLTCRHGKQQSQLRKATQQHRLLLWEMTGLFSPVFSLWFFQDLRLTSRKALVNSSCLHFQECCSVRMVTFATALARAS